MADTKKSPKVREFRLFELERIAAGALAKGPKCVRGRRVDIERLVQETFGLKIIAFHELSRRWKTYAFIDTTGKAVFVVAKLDFGKRHGVVFVDDGYDAAVEQCDERVARIEMTFVMLEIIVREQHLRDAQIVRGEKFFVNGHEPRLADGGAGLQFSRVGRPFFIAERAHAGADCAGGDEHNFPTRFSQRSDLGGELFQLRLVGLLAAVGEHTRAEFNDDASGGFDGFAMHAARLEKISRAENAKMQCREPGFAPRLLVRVRTELWRIDRQTDCLNAMQPDENHQTGQIFGRFHVFDD